jgi:hypothetical protein
LTNQSRFDILNKCLKRSETKPTPKVTPNLENIIVWKPEYNKYPASEKENNLTVVVITVERATDEPKWRV